MIRIGSSTAIFTQVHDRTKGGPSSPTKPDIKGKGRADGLPALSPLSIQTQDTKMELPLTLILISKDKDAHAHLRDMAEAVIPELAALHLDPFAHVAPVSPHSPGTPGMPSTPRRDMTFRPDNVLHWAFRSTNLVQVIQSPSDMLGSPPTPEVSTSAEAEDLYTAPSIKSIYRIYRELSCKHSRGTTTNSATKMVMIDRRHVLWRGQNFLLFVTHKVDVDKKTALVDANTIRRAIKAKEDELFIFHSPSF